MTDPTTIPIYLIGYNNSFWIQRMVDQLKKYHMTVVLIDNASTDPQTVEYLAKEFPYQIIRMDKNYGHTVYDHIIDQLPDLFFLSDPDLDLNSNMPVNFPSVMLALSEELKASKVGLALDISEPELFLKGDYFQGRTIVQWEKQFWTQPIKSDKYPDLSIYQADIDTTFCLVNKKYYSSGKCYRLADWYTCNHLPWYKDIWLQYPWRQFDHYYRNSLCSTTVKLFNQTTIMRNFRVSINSPSFAWWKENYATWEQSTFVALDRYLDKDKDFLDIGSWIGLLSYYAARKSREVYAVECDRGSLFELKLNDLVNNSRINIIDYAVYKEDGATIWFGPNRFIPKWGNQMNLSVSQIDTNKSTELDYPVTTISFNSLIQRCGDNLSAIKVDIEGAEEHILDQILNYLRTTTTPCIVSFHYTWWRHHRLDQFDFTGIRAETLDQQFLPDVKQWILKDPFISVVLQKE